MDEIEEIIPRKTNLTFLIKISEFHKIGAEAAGKNVGEQILELEEKGNFRIIDISPYFDISDMIIKLDILTLKPFFPKELISILESKLELIRPEGPIISIYYPPLIRILRGDIRKI